MTFFSRLAVTLGPQKSWAEELKGHFSLGLRVQLNDNIDKFYTSVQPGLTPSNFGLIVTTMSKAHAGIHHHDVLDM